MAKKLRSPAYPAIDLRAAVELVRKCYPESKHSLGGDVLADLWGYKNLLSASPYLAALKQYGLLVEERSGEDRMFKLSDIALDIAVDEDEKSGEFTDAIIQAALKPKIHKELWAKWGNELPPDAEIKRYLERERSFNPKHVSRFVKSYKATLEYTNELKSLFDGEEIDLDTANNGSDHETPPKAVQVGSYVQWTSQGVDQFPVPRSVVGTDGEYAFVEGNQAGLPMSELSVMDPPTEHKLPPANPFYKLPQTTNELPQEGIALDRTTLDEGAVRLEWPDSLSEDSVEEFQDWMIGRINRARRKAGLEKIKIAGEK